MGRLFSFGLGIAASSYVPTGSLAARRYAGLGLVGRVSRRDDLCG